MSSRLAFVVAPLALAALVGCAGDVPTALDGEAPALALVPGEQGGRPFSLALTGAAEAPNPGDPDGSGTARLTLNQGQGEVCFELEVADIALPATGAHVHRAPVGVAGPIVVPLTPPDASGHSSGCVAVDAALVKEIRQQPGAFYLNVHSSEHPGGAVRAQLDG